MARQRLRPTPVHLGQLHPRPRRADRAAAQRAGATARAGGRPLQPVVQHRHLRRPLRVPPQGRDGLHRRGRGERGAALHARARRADAGGGTDAARTRRTLRALLGAASPGFRQPARHRPACLAAGARRRHPSDRDRRHRRCGRQRTARPGSRRAWPAVGRGPDAADRLGNQAFRHGPLRRHRDAGRRDAGPFRAGRHPPRGGRRHHPRRVLRRCARHVRAPARDADRAACEDRDDAGQLHQCALRRRGGQARRAAPCALRQRLHAGQPAGGRDVRRGQARTGGQRRGRAVQLLRAGLYA